jgi:uncharacterized protein (TIGR02452 family)
MNKTEQNINRINQIRNKYSNYGISSSLELNPVFNLPTSNQDVEISFVKKYIGDYLKYDNISDDCILNFASAKHAGGGVLKGCVAQEEDICRNSLLYSGLAQFNDYYENKILRGSDNYYTNFLIFSKDVPTVNDDLVLSNKNSYITSVAPNFNQIDNFDSNRYELIMRNRIKNVIGSAILHGCRKITLGAWGCGVFKNDPYLVSKYFNDIIDLYGGNFEKITFVIPDEVNLDIFKKTINCYE